MSYHFRLPDGNIDGKGFATTAFGSIARLRGGDQSSLAAVDGSATYAGWRDLRDTLRAALVAEAEGESPDRIAIHTHDPESRRNHGDHSDHVTTGALVTEAASDLGAPITYLRGDVAKRPANPRADAASKAASSRLRRQRALADPHWSAYGESPTYYYPFFFRTYATSVLPHSSERATTAFHRAAR